VAGDIAGCGGFDLADAADAVGALGWCCGLAVGCGAFFGRQQLDRDGFTYQAKMPQVLGGVSVVLLSLYLAVFPALRRRGRGFSGVMRAPWCRPLRACGS
jgi:hypothetical protein